MLIASTLSWDCTFFHHIWQGLFTASSATRPSRAAAVMWICRLGFIYGAPPDVLSARVFLKVFPEQRIGRDGPTAWPARLPVLNSLDFYIWGYLKSAVYATKVNDFQGLQQRVQNGTEMIRMTLVFSSDSGNHCSDVQRPALKLNVDISRIFFRIQKAETRKTRSRGRMFKNIFFTCIVV